MTTTTPIHLSGRGMPYAWDDGYGARYVAGRPVAAVTLPRAVPEDHR